MINELSPTTLTTGVLIGDIVVTTNGSPDSIPRPTLAAAGVPTLLGTPVTAALEIKSTTGALLLPRMTTTQRNALNAVPGMTIYNLTTAQFENYNAGAWGAASSGAPANATYILQTPNGSLTNAQALSVLATGLLKSTTATGVVSSATAGTDYYSPGKPTYLQDTLIGGFNNVSVGSPPAVFGAGIFSVAIGDNVLQSNIVGTRLTTVGAQSLFANTTGVDNSAFGCLVLTVCNVGKQNSGFGSSALMSMTSSDNASAFGFNALKSNTVTSSSAFGAFALEDNTTGAFNSGFGFSAIANNISGAFNSGFGYQALLNAAASNNSAFGSNALQTLTSGSDNCAFGKGALTALTTASSNCAFGSGAMGNTTNTDFSVAVGHLAMRDNQTGGNNTSVGALSFISSVTGDFNTVLGFAALQSIDGSSSNTAVGAKALQNTTSGPNTALGFAALENCSIGINNTACGGESQFQIDAGNRNSTLGRSTLVSATNCDDNVAVGYLSASNQSSYTGCVFLGAGADASVNTLTNAGAIGHNASVATSNSLVLGNSMNVGIGTSSPTSTLHVVGTSTLGTILGQQTIFTSVNQTTTSVTMTTNVRYLANNAALVTLTLPTTSAIGDILELAGVGAGGWKIAQAAGQQIHIGSATTTVGVGGSVASTNQYDSVRLVCIVANTTWSSLGGPQGTLTIV